MVATASIDLLILASRCPRLNVEITETTVTALGRNKRSSLQQSDAIAGRFPGGRPLRRRRETVLIYGRHGCEGPQSSTRSLLRKRAGRLFRSAILERRFALELELQLELEFWE